MKFDDYKYALDGGVSFMRAMAIRTNHHKLETDVIIKRGLSNFDDKRYCENGVDTLALGYCHDDRSILDIIFAD